MIEENGNREVAFMTWKIQALGGDLDGQVLNIDRDMWVGRHQAADLVLAAAEVSRKHAAFIFKDDALWVQDLGSSNGTFVNEQRIATETALVAGDVVGFAGIKFTVLGQSEQIEPVVEAEKTVAEQMNDQGMPDLKERDPAIQLTRDGMPTNVGIPKPAPIPEGIDLTAVQPEPAPVPVEQPVSRVAEEKEAQKNASVGLISVIVLIILAIMAWLFFK